MRGSPVHQAMAGLRLLPAAMIFIHGAARVGSGGVAPFGEFLDGVGPPVGLLVAWGITLMELGGSIALGLGYLVRPLALYFAAVLLAGIVLVHAREGWFVVGLGRNGMEYSVVLIGLFLAQAWAAGDGVPGARSREG